MARVHLAGGSSELDAMLARIQNDLFDLGADLCVPETSREVARQRERLRVSDIQVERLEAEIDRMTAELEPLRSFVLPGGAPAAAALHVARTVCRRAERAVVALANEPHEHVSAPALKYINRLSDLLFVAGRMANDRGRSDVLWVPGQNR
jgi:cob(I)alamin adenosyltransferase